MRVRRVLGVMRNSSWAATKPMITHSDEEKPRVLESVETPQPAASTVTVEPEVIRWQADPERWRRVGLAHRQPRGSRRDPCWFP